MHTVALCRLQAMLVQQNFINRSATCVDKIYWYCIKAVRCSQEFMAHVKDVLTKKYWCKKLVNNFQILLLHWGHTSLKIVFTDAGSIPKYTPFTKHHTTKCDLLSHIMLIN